MSGSKRVHPAYGLRAPGRSTDTQTGSLVTRGATTQEGGGPGRHAYRPREQGGGRSRASGAWKEKLKCIAGASSVDPGPAMPNRGSVAEIGFQLGPLPLPVKQWSADRPIASLLARSIGQRLRRKHARDNLVADAVQSVNAPSQSHSGRPLDVSAVPKDLDYERCAPS